LYRAQFGERLLAQLLLAFARHQRLRVAIAHHQQQIVANQRDVLLHALDGFWIVSHHLHGDLQEAHRGTVFEIHHQRRIDGKVDCCSLGARAFFTVGSHRHWNDGFDPAVLVQLQIGKRVQLRVDEAADHDGNESQHENAYPVDEISAAGFFRRGKRSIGGGVSHGQFLARSHTAKGIEQVLCQNACD
jgi:hypothetical protein